MVIVSVRGMGVAVMTRTSGAGSRAVSLARCATPNLCCSSITARPRFANVHGFIEERMRADDDLGGGIVSSPHCAFRVAHASRVLVSASRRNALSLSARHPGSKPMDNLLLALTTPRVPRISQDILNFSSKSRSDRIIRSNRSFSQTPPLFLPILLIRVRRKRFYRYAAILSATRRPHFPHHRSVFRPWLNKEMDVIGHHASRRTSS